MPIAVSNRRTFISTPANVDLGRPSLNRKSMKRLMFLSFICICDDEMLRVGYFRTPATNNTYHVFFFVHHETDLQDKHLDWTVVVVCIYYKVAPQKETSSFVMKSGTSRERMVLCNGRNRHEVNSGTTQRIVSTRNIRFVWVYRQTKELYRSDLFRGIVSGLACSVNLYAR